MFRSGCHGGSRRLEQGIRSRAQGRDVAVEEDAWGASMRWRSDVCDWRQLPQVRAPSPCGNPIPGSHHGCVVGGGRPPLGSPYATTVQSTKIWMTRQGLQIWQGVLVAATMYCYCQISGSSVENQLFPSFFCIGIDTSLGRCNVIAFSITQCAVNNCAVPHAWLGENSGAG